MRPNNTVSTISRALQTELTPIYGEGEAKAIVRLIFHSLKGWSFTDMVIHSDNEVSEYILDKIDSIKKRLLDNEPIQYILGEAYFYGLNLCVTRDTLIPRPETEELVDLIIRENNAPDIKVLDIGTGSGAIAIALARNLKFPKVSALDISDRAISVAEDNAKRLHLDINFITADIFCWSNNEERYDIIVSNPPYIDNSEKLEMEKNVLDYEPHSALFVPDENPLLFYSRISQVAIDSLRSGGRIYFEINPRHSDEVVKLLKDDGFIDIVTLNDSYNKTRFIKAVHQ